ncbi:FAD-dependent oxidoreductase [Lysinibacillus yapensis]|uniref:FAD-dependent oxidoreductase n=1 Tax=Ureibacillus yapensis TaxID=2304605 RepID=A0A396SCW8_9BACL|nr:FAD-dependent oxidoreductase [Lysinibacillus yapensis]RHW34916.1 FAD-dependent oxidoreductase [Lysinibacillus yapensis]
MQNSLWLKDLENAMAFPTLDTSVDCDVCIVGGGLSGIYTAYLLAKKGLKVVLLEAKPSFAIGTTGHSTGKLTPQHGVVFSKLIKNFSIDEVATYYQANKKAIESALQVASKDTFQKVDSYLYATTISGLQTIENELYAYKEANIAGYGTKETELPFDITGALKMEDTAQIHPPKFAAHFVNLALKEGAALYTNTRVTKVEIDEKFVLTDYDVKVSYKKLVLCTHYPIESIKGLITTKLSIDRSYLLASPTKELWKGQYLSVENASRTIRTGLVSDAPYFIYGGGSHIAGEVEETQTYYEELKEEMMSTFNLEEPSFMWSAQDPNTPDKIPYIGVISDDTPDLYIATGYRKWGLSNSLVAGEIISCSITHENHPAAKLYSPTRDQFGKNLLRGLSTIGFVTANLAEGYLTRTEAPKCTHLGCKTRWNDGDETWDCPCHGSRYDKNGNVIEGPAVYPLKLKK